MKRVFENVAIGVGCFVVLVFTLTGTYVFAKDPTVMEDKSYHVEGQQEKDRTQKNLDLSESITKKVETSQNSIEYEFRIVNGNVILINLNNGSKSAVYTKGDALGGDTINGNEYNNSNSYDNYNNYNNSYSTWIWFCTWIF